MTRGGKRQGAGRKPGSGRFGELTRPIRVPESLLDAVQAFVESRGYYLPLYESRVQAGFPSPADDFSEGMLDINEYLVKNPASTFYVRAQGNSMTGAGIFEGDILVVDRSLDVVSGKIIIAVVNGDLTVKRFCKEKDGRVLLMAENPLYKSIEITDEMDFSVWGVVTNVVRSF
ncbi:MAG TPA: translesion error-prone DNA polymerase V autoproteolytic subunit [Oligoflexia bacterium]|nr:translesion error-prone DNA polymerase V autoproteolytic subunit [Oligoflexia bacterium]HMP48815.1 translesion error-prone DNA polymerase V autoproteolytic subunit [Oligoflexia bacterium]